MFQIVKKKQQQKAQKYHRAAYVTQTRRFIQ